MCTKERIVINSDVIYKELYEKAKSRMKAEKNMAMKMFHNTRNQTWQEPFFYLIDELEKSHISLSLQEKLGALAHLKAHVVHKKTLCDWFWQLISIVSSLVALLIAIVALYDTSGSCLEEIASAIKAMSPSCLKEIADLINISPSCLNKMAALFSTAPSHWDNMAVILTFIVVALAVIKGSYILIKYSVDQYVLAIVESVESYYRDCQTMNQPKDTCDAHIDKT